LTEETARRAGKEGEKGGSPIVQPRSKKGKRREEV